uniref:Major facilitator superfamily (MFS) profile domain-containing protein n=1 Tax=Chromera velia CCMP2878 TaxID=1169474 RepID=A0A0G4GWL5_9ALVE|eukprot:Cvel_23700.t1-p1 / transcript=Cvel_23700.t1 / gene=Cvel_23700 / organism=Chromera_velia_CCMP2878 / gene_product=hypothetical protein / transcript_product=hypothetical protein / location=Cvel_scaffold2473:19418-27463(-) / protein_length=578 / sequence_SO=supercontig / SO=protein_coding / is_pseudo=false
MWEDQLSPGAVRNIYLVYAFRILNGLSLATRSGMMFDNYIFELSGDNKSLGNLVLQSSFAGLLVSPLAGFAVTYFRRKRANILRLSAGLLGFCIVLNYYGIMNRSLSGMKASAVAWRAWYELVAVCSEALFADSIPQGQRSKFFVRRRLCTTLANGMGPLLTAAVLYFSANRWEFEVLERVLIFGVLLSVPQMAVLAGFVDLWEEGEAEVEALDKKSREGERRSMEDRMETGMAKGEENGKGGSVELEREKERESSSPTTTSARRMGEGKSDREIENGGRGEGESPQGGPASSVGERRSPADARTPLISRERDVRGRMRAAAGGPSVESSAAARRSSVNPNSVVVLPRQRRLLCLTAEAVPWIILLTTCVTFSGAGMSVKYFGLFFRTEFGLSPLQLCLMHFFYTLSMASFTWAAQKVSRQLGRAQTSALFAVGGIVCMVLLARARYLPVVLLCYFVRGSLQNAASPLDKSIVMDYVQPRWRGLWQSLQVAPAVIWAASAFLGGRIADRYSYRTTYMFTAGIYCLANLVYCPLLFLVPRQERFARRGREGQGSPVAKTGSGASPSHGTTVQSGSNALN